MLEMDVATALASLLHVGRAEGKQSPVPGLVFQGGGAAIWYQSWPSQQR